jgi:hypothetical protein
LLVGPSRQRSTTFSSCPRRTIRCCRRSALTRVVRSFGSKAGIDSRVLVTRATLPPMERVLVVHHHAASIHSRCASRMGSCKSNTSQRSKKPAHDS